MPSRVLIVSPETAGVNMSGPAIRYWQLSQALASELAVTLAIPGPADLSASSFRVVEYAPQNDQSLRRCALDADVVVCAGFLMHRYPFLKTLTQPIVADLYDPFVLENLEIHAAKPLAEQAAIHRIDLMMLNEQLRRGDFFLCASDRQRDFCLGMLLANGRINPSTVRVDRTLRQLIDVVAFGIPDTPPERQGAVLKGIYPGIPPNARVVYWGGGIWEWLDPLTAIRAMAEVSRQRPEVVLFFAGVRHPNPEVPPVRMAAAAQELSRSLGLTERCVFFNDWIPYARRGDYLSEADIGLSLHLDNIETHFAYRTRLLDYIWAGLPMVVTGGDALSARAEKAGVATIVPPGDASAVATALLQQLERADRQPSGRARPQILVDEMRWSTVVRPLLDFCRSPRRAADYSRQKTMPALKADLVAKAWRSLRGRGVPGLIRDIGRYLGL